MLTAVVTFIAGPAQVRAQVGANPPRLDATRIAFAIQDVVGENPVSRTPLFQLTPAPPAGTPSISPPPEIVSLYGSYAVLQLLDTHSTIRAVNAGAREWNPVMSGAASHPFTLSLVKSGATVATIYLTEKLRARNPTAALALMVGLNCVYFAVVAHNYADGRPLH